MESLSFLLGGFATALEPANLLFALAGCLLGTLIGILPGIGPVAGTALLLPVTFGLPPTAGIIMLAAIYYGAMYGGTLTSVLVNVPGEAASAITCLEGYEMARQGRAGPALTIAALGSFIGGIVATLGLVLLAVPLTRLALKFGPPEFFALMLVGLSLVTGLAGRSVLLALISAVVGLLIAMVGIDPVAGAPRFTFGRLELMSGINVVIVAMGLFGVGEILLSVDREVAMKPIGTRLRDLFLGAEDARRSVLPVVRGTAIGFFLGLIPGVGAVVPTVMSYVAEKRMSKTPERFGTGMIEGVAGPETANNAYATSALIPLFTLGIPGSPTVAIIMGAFMMKGLIPGPFLFRDHAEVAWGVIASLCVGNVMLLVLNLPLIPLWVKLLRIPAAGPLRLHPGILRDRRLQHQRPDVRRRADGGVRCPGIPVQEDRRAAGAADPDAHPRAADGAVAAPVARDLAGRFLDPAHPAHLADPDRHRRHLHDRLDHADRGARPGGRLGGLTSATRG